MLTEDSGLPKYNELEVPKVAAVVDMISLLEKI